MSLSSAPFRSSCPPAFALAGFLVVFALAQKTTAQPIFETASGQVTFTSEVPTHTFSGSSDHVVGRISFADSTVDFYVDVHTLDTGIERRDRDMIETLNAEDHPFAEFFGTFASDVTLQPGVPDSVTVKGEFSVNGVTRNVRVEGVMERTKKGLRVAADWTVRLDDYNIEPPGILFYRVDDKQDISLRAHLEPASDS